LDSVKNAMNRTGGFPNGNGCHSRLMADLLIVQLGGHPFTWGSQSLAERGQVRKLYVEALLRHLGHLSVLTVTTSPNPDQSLPSKRYNLACLNGV